MDGATCGLRDVGLCPLIPAPRPYPEATEALSADTRGGGGGAMAFLKRPSSRGVLVAAARASSESSATPMLRSSAPPYTEPPEGGATANSSSPWSCWRCTMRKPRRSKRNAMAELDPTPSFTLSQSSPEVLSTTAHAWSSSLPSPPTRMR